MKHIISIIIIFHWATLEKICKGYLDHLPVELKLDTSDNNFKYASHNQHYSDYYDDGRNHLINKYPNNLNYYKYRLDFLCILLLDLITFAVFICGCCMAGACIGSSIYHFYHKTMTNYKYDHVPKAVEQEV